MRDQNGLMVPSVMLFQSRVMLLLEDNATTLRLPGHSI